MEPLSVAVLLAVSSILVRFCAALDTPRTPEPQEPLPVVGGVEVAEGAAQEGAGGCPGASL